MGIMGIVESGLVNIVEFTKTKFSVLAFLGSSSRNKSRTL